MQSAYISEQLSRLMKPEDANLWLVTPIRLLDGSTPAELVQQQEVRMVQGLIDALADGVVI
jgi:uncharacterized protein (DUF2384 family)